MIRSMANTAARTLASVFASSGEAPESPPCLPRVIEKKCTGCGFCTRVCMAEVMEVRGKKATVVNPRWCSRCGHCVAVCPADAVQDSLGTRKHNRLLDTAALPSAKSLELFFRSRRSMRVYRDIPVSQKDLEKILEAGTCAPTAGNRQDVAYIVLRDPAEIRELREMVFPFVLRMFAPFNNRGIKPILEACIGPESVASLKEYLPLLELFRERWQNRGEDRIFFHAPALVLVHGTRFDDTVGVSCSVALYQVSLMAQALNVGSCYNGFLQVAVNNNRKVKQWLGIPWRSKCYGALTLGYPKVVYRRMVRREPPKVTWR